MVKTRADNGQFQRQQANYFAYIRLTLIIIALTPLLYYIFVRRNLLVIVLDFLNSELGCHCNKDNGTTTEASTKKQGYF